MGKLYPSVLIRSNEDHRLSIILNLTQNLLNMRLQELVEDSYSLIESQYYQMEIVNNMSASFIYMTPNRGQFSIAFQALIDEIDRFSQFGITESELEREKANVKAQFLRYWQNRESIESSVIANEIVNSILTNTPFLSPEQKYHLIFNALDTITVQEVNSVIKNHYSGRGTRLLTMTYPNSGIPSKSAIDRLWKNYRNRNLSPYQDILDNRPLFPLHLTGNRGEIMSESIISNNPTIVELMLSNGAKVIVCKTDFEKGFFNFSAISKGGLSTVDDDDYIQTVYSPVYALRSGLNGFK